MTQEQTPGGESSIAPRDAGWAELVSRDASVRYGRGHLMIWPGVRVEASANGPTRIDADAAFPVGENAPGLRGELRSFTADGDPVPVSGGPFSVRPEQEGGTAYPVVLSGPLELGTNAVLALRWMDGHLPSALSEVGGE